MSRPPRKSVKALPTAEDYRRERQKSHRLRAKAKRHDIHQERRGLKHDPNLGMKPFHWEMFAGNQRQTIKNELAALAPQGGGVKTHEGNFAQYLFDRHIDNREIQGTGLEHLRNANDSVEETRNRLSSGRGNVIPDINRPFLQHDATRRTEIGRDMTSTLHRGEGNINNSRYGQLSAATAEFTRAGNCGEHGNVATHIHAKKLSWSDEVHKVASKVTDHAWSELRTFGGTQSNDVIMDAWSKGPAILREDSSFASNPDNVNSEYSYNAFSGPQNANASRQVFTDLSNNPSAHQHASNIMSQMQQSNFKYNSDTYLPTEATSVSFRAQTDQQRSKIPVAFPAAQIAAIAVSRSLGDNIGQAASRSERVVGRGISKDWS